MQSNAPAHLKTVQVCSNRYPLYLPLNEVERPFPQEEELSQKMERLAELNALLDMDHKDNEIVESEPDVVEVAERKDGEVER